MRSALLYSIYSGQLFFAPVAILLVVAILDLSRFLDKRTVARRVAGFAALLAIPLAILAAPPVPLALALITLAVIATYVFYGFAKTPRRDVLASAAAVACIALLALELPYHLLRTTATQPSPLFVIGDSLSSGDFGEQQPWPRLIGNAATIEVTNLSLAGAHVSDAIERQLPQLPPAEGGSVIIAIGGNDMLDATPVDRFGADLERIIITARGNGRREVIVLELPLLPGRWSYGLVQRRLARKHDCVLVPKRIIAGALVRRGNTSDGLHLTQQGHADLARGLIEWLGWAGKS